LLTSWLTLGVAPRAASVARIIRSHPARVRMNGSLARSRTRTLELAASACPDSGCTAGPTSQSQAGPSPLAPSYTGPHVIDRGITAAATVPCLGAL
jgi:hypothetical protein